MVDMDIDLIHLVWVAWLSQAWLSVLLVRKFLVRRVLRGSHQQAEPYTPFATVIVPFKDLDLDLPAGLRSLLEQDYPDYRLICVVQSEDDPACSVLREILAQHPHCQAEVLISGSAGPNQGQKVHNQLAVLAHIQDDVMPDQVYVFADSDAVVGKQWLKWMVSPLRKDQVGVTTGYRWLIPQGQSVSLWSHLASIINSSVVSMMSRHRLIHAWGGSMAMRVSTAQRGNLVGRLTGALTDDYPITAMSRSLGLKVHYVPECLVPTPVDFNWATLSNFAFRQYLITRVYRPGIYYPGLALLLLYAAGLLSAWGGLVAGLLAGGYEWLLPAGVLIAVFVAHVVRSGYRRRIVRHVFDPAAQKAMRPTMWLDRYATSLWMLLHLGLMLSALCSRQMTWRGIRYRLLAPQHVLRLEP